MACLKEIVLPETGISSAFYASDIVCALVLNLNTPLLDSNLWTLWNSKQQMCSNLSVLMLWYHFPLCFSSCTCFSHRTWLTEVSLCQPFPSVYIAFLSCPPSFLVYSLPSQLSFFYFWPLCTRPLPIIFCFTPSFEMGGQEAGKVCVSEQSSCEAANPPLTCWAPDGASGGAAWTAQQEDLIPLPLALDLPRYHDGYEWTAGPKREKDPGGAALSLSG